MQLFGAAIVSAIVGLSQAISLDVDMTPGQRDGIANVLQMAQNLHHEIEQLHGEALSQDDADSLPKPVDLV